MDTGDVTQVENTATKKTDTIMILNYNSNTKKINVVSVPRDTRIEVDAYDGYGYLKNYWKMDTAYTLGGEEELIYHVENLLDITVNYILKVDYTSFINFIDALGGVEMYIEEDISTNMPYSKMIFYGFKFLFNDGISMSTLEGYLETLYDKEEFLVIEKEANKEIIDSIKTDKVLDENSSIEDYKILILNGSGVDLSNNKKVREQLKLDVGITNVEKDKNDNYFDYDAVIIIGEKNNIN